MAAIITEKFRLNNAKQFVEDVTESSSATYTFIGRGHSWTDDASFSSTILESVWFRNTNSTTT